MSRAIRAHKQDQENELANLHYPFLPEDIRQGSLITAKLKIRGASEDKAKNMNVWRMSPLGIEMVAESHLDLLPKGSEIDLELTIGTQVTYFEGLVVDCISERFDRKIIGIRLSKRVQPRTGAERRASGTRWTCSDQFAPTCVASNPAKFNDFLYFRLKDISAKGAQLVTSLRNKFIVPGMRFECLVSLPMISQIRMVYTVQYARVITEQGKDFLSLGCRAEAVDTRSREAIGQYLIQFGEVNNLTEILDQDLMVQSASKAINFTYVKTDSEYKQVLALRHLAYEAQDKLCEGQTIQDMSDIYDSRSRIVIGTYRGRVVASCRLTFSGFDDKMEVEEYIKWPHDLPHRSEVVEMSRLCTHPEFRGSDILLSLFQFMALTIVQSKRQYVVISTTEKMLKLYRHMGFKDTGLSCRYEKLNNMEHKTLYADVVEGMNGKNLGPIYWNLIWKDVAKYMTEYNIIIPDPFAQIRIGLYRLLSPIAWLAKYFSRRPRKKNK